jgi:hypothetical protein
VTAENRFFVFLGFTDFVDFIDFVGFIDFVARALLPACPISCKPPFSPSSSAGADLHRQLVGRVVWPPVRD